MTNRSLACSLLLAVLCSPLAACGDDDDGAAPTPDAAPASPDAATACSGDMFAKYGLDAFVAVNNSIIDKAVAAPTAMLGTSFQNLAAEGSARVEEFRTNLANFLVYVYGGPNNYTGPTMLEAHTGLAITAAQYDYFIANVVVPALSDNGVPEADINNCFAPPVVDADFKASIVGH